MDQIFILENTVGLVNQERQIAFTTIDKACEYLTCNYDLDNVHFVDAPLNDNTLYWTIENDEIKKRRSFMMPIPNDGVFMYKKYMLYYDGARDHSYVVNLVKLNP